MAGNNRDNWEGIGRDKKELRECREDQTTSYACVKLSKDKNE